MTNKVNTVLYTGLTNNLKKRAYQHKQKIMDGFTKRYNCTKLIYYEVFGDVSKAIKREKQIKSWSRKRKDDLVRNFNPKWNDLFETISRP